MNAHASAAVLRNRLRGHRVTRVLLVTAGAAAVLTTTIMGSPAGATSSVTGTGSPACSSGWSGVLHFLPALKTGGTAASEEISMHAHFGCSGGSPAPVPAPTSGTYDGKGVVVMAAANACANWFAPYPGPFPLVNFAANTPLDGNVAWAPTGINPSNVRFAAMQIRTKPSGRLVVKLPPPPGFGTVTGSYAPTSQLTLRILQQYPAAIAACGSPSGLSSLTIVASNLSGISHGTW